MSEDKEIRRKIYHEYIMKGIKERREEYRFLKKKRKEEAYGSKGYIEELKEMGLKTIWSHKGKPKKRRVK